MLHAAVTPAAEQPIGATAAVDAPVPASSIERDIATIGSVPSSSITATIVRARGAQANDCTGRSRALVSSMSWPVCAIQKLRAPTGPTRSPRRAWLT